MSEAPASAPPWRVVLIDDSVDDRAGLRRMLQSALEHTCKFLEAGTVADALRLLLARTDDPIHVVIIDHHLPDGTSFDVLAALPRVDGHVAWPVIVITGREGSNVGRQLLRAGAQDFVSKDWLTPGSLARAVEHAAERWSMMGELKASEARFRHLARSVPQPVWVLDAEGALTYVNDRWREYFGDMAGSTWLSTVHPDEVDAARKAMDARRERREPFQADMRLRRHDGEYRWHRVNIVPIRDERGAVTHCYGINTDIHEHQEARHRLRLALAASKTGIWTWDLATDAVTWTPECYVILGLAEGQFAGTGAAFFALVHPDDRARVERAVQEALANHTIFRSEFRVVRPDGAAVWVENLGSAVYDSRQSPRMTGTITDISARKEAALALQQRERELQDLADTSPDIMARFDRELRHVFINTAIERVTGRSAADFLGKTNRDLGMPAALCDVWDEAARSVFETGQPREIDFDYPAPDGTHSFASRMVPQVGPEGRIDFMLVVSSDVTRDRQAREALRVSEERLTRAQTAARTGTWDWNVETGVVSWTREAWRLFGRPPTSAPVTFDDWLGAIHPDDREAAVAAARRALTEGTYREDFRVVHPDGTTLWLESVGEAVLGADGAPVRLLGTVRDITVRREAERALKDALERAERAVVARDQLMSLVSHDLRGPLTIFRLGIEALEPAVDEWAAQVMKRMVHQAERMSGLIDELLDASQLQAGKHLALERCELDLVALVRECVADFQLSHPDRTIVVTADRESLVGEWDPARLRRVLGNLISNALKYSPSGGAVHLDMKATEVASAACVELRVTDQGIGIAAEDQERLFEWFSRARSARDARIQGVGIGLAGVRRIVEHHGGEVSVESQEGRGSTFTVRLPLWPEVPGLATAAETQVPPVGQLDRHGSAP